MFLSGCFGGFFYAAVLVGRVTAGNKHDQKSWIHTHKDTQHYKGHSLQTLDYTFAHD